MSPQHTLKAFDHDLEEIRDKVLGMARMTSQELHDCFQAFSERDEALATDASGADELINASERQIDELIVRALTRRQPMASDCRNLIAALRISRDLERIGDYATNIANHSTTLDQLQTTGEEQRVLDLGHAVQTMLDEAIQAYAEGDAALAETVRDQDEDIDRLYTKIFADLVEISRGQGEAACASIHLLFIARSLERIGDHITDIAEEIIYVINGDFPEDERHKADESAFVLPGTTIEE